MRFKQAFKFCLEHPVLKYVTAVLAAALAVIVRMQLTPLLLDQSRYFILLPLTMVWAIYAGFWPALVLNVLGSIMTIWVLIPPAGTFNIHKPSDINGLVVHFLVTSGILWLIWREGKQKQRRILIERQLEGLNSELEAKVAERTSELKTANEELEQFCYSMAHDLRTPSRAIAGNARILAEDYGHLLTPELSVHLQRINRAALKLGQLVDSLLIYARLAKQELQPGPVLIGKMVEEIATQEAKRSGAKLELDVDTNLEVEADERQIRILIRALVENSLLYRTLEGPCRIRFQKSGDDLVFQDNGIGFEMDYVHKVFMPFERLHREEAYPGVGMGLANAERVVNRHGGQISIYAELNKGATVRIFLPNVTTPERELAGTARAAR